MPLQEYFDPETINIRRLAVESPKKTELLFDAEQEISNEEWKILKDSLFRNYFPSPAGAQLIGFTKLATELKILFPERLSDLEIDSASWEAVKTRLEEYKSDKGWGDFTEIVANLRVLYPERFSTLDLGEKAWQVGVESLHQLEGIWVTDHALRLKILFPEKFSSLDLDFVWKNLKEGIGEIRKDDEFGYKSFFEVLAKARILFPERYAELRPSPRDWSVMKECFEGMRENKEWWSFAKVAASMKILAAEEVSITKNGYEIKMPGDESFKHDSLPPEKRKF